VSQSATRTVNDDLPLMASLWPAERIARWLGGAYFLLIVIAALALRLPGSTIRGNELSLERCVFTSFNAATLTGFQQGVSLDHYGALGQFIVVTLMVLGTLLSLIIGGLALNAALRLNYSSAKIVGATLYIYVMALALGTTLLLESSRGLLASATQAASAFGNCGLFIGRLPAADDWRTHLVLMPLVMAGGLSIPVLLEISEAMFGRRKLSVHSGTVLMLLALMYVLGTVALAPWKYEDLTTGLTATGVARSSTMSLNSRTCGLPLASMADMSRGAQWLVVTLMLIGAAPGGVAGGMKITALFHVFRGMRRAWRSEPGLRITAVAAAWIAGYTAFIFIMFLALLTVLPQMAADRLIFLAASAVGNVGLAHEPVVVTGTGLYVLSFAMLVGRAAPLMLLWWVAKNVKDVDVAI
jgi:trk system potassium uptake protein